MKFGKITSANVSSNALAMGGALAGGALSNGLMTFVPAEQEVLARGGMTVVGLAGAASIKGTTSAERLVKFGLLGFAIAQGTALVNKFAQKQMDINETSTASQRFVGGMVGLACPCEGAYPALAAPVLNFADMDQYQPEQIEAGVPEGAF